MAAEPSSTYCPESRKQRLLGTFKDDLATRFAATGLVKAGGITQQRLISFVDSAIFTGSAGEMLVAPAGKQLLEAMERKLEEKRAIIFLTNLAEKLQDHLRRAGSEEESPPPRHLDDPAGLFDPTPKKAPPLKTQPGVLDDAWVELLVQSGGSYFWNRKSGERTWELPQGRLAKWVGQKSSGGRTYYWTEGGKAVWTLPPLAGECGTAAAACKSIEKPARAATSRLAADASNGSSSSDSESTSEDSDSSSSEPEAVLSAADDAVGMYDLLTGDGTVAMPQEAWSSAAQELQFEVPPVVGSSVALSVDALTGLVGTTQDVAAVAVAPVDAEVPATLAETRFPEPVAPPDDSKDAAEVEPSPSCSTAEITLSTLDKQPTAQQVQLLRNKINEMAANLPHLLVGLATMKEELMKLTGEVALTVPSKAVGPPAHTAEVADAANVESGCEDVEVPSGAAELAAQGACSSAASSCGRPVGQGPCSSDANKGRAASPPPGIDQRTPRPRRSRRTPSPHGRVAELRARLASSAGPSSKRQRGSHAGSGCRTASPDGFWGATPVKGTSSSATTPSGAPPPATQPRPRFGAAPPVTPSTAPASAEACTAAEAVDAAVDFWAQRPRSRSPRATPGRAAQMPWASPPPPPSVSRREPRSAGNSECLLERFLLGVRQTTARAQADAKTPERPGRGRRRSSMGGA